jgi:hypothetical protein
MRIQGHMATSLDILTEPTQEVYAQLIALASECCTTFCLVWRDQLSFAASADHVASLLAGFIIREERTDRWPGTVLSSTMATVRHYRVTPESLAVLQQQSGLYAWRAPDLPEDLVFYRAEGIVWLASISHEQDAWFEAVAVAGIDLQRRVPGLNFAASAT